jgi:integrase
MTHHPYWVNVAQGVAVGYRRGPKASTWHARFREAGTRYKFQDMGAADDFQDANGETVLTYFQACDKARALAKERDRRRGIGIVDEITVEAAAKHYMTWFIAHRKGITTTQHIIDAFILPAFGTRKVSSLKKKEITDWRDRLAAAPARKRTKVGKAQASRAAPKTEDERRARRATVNRTLSVFKAVLNKAGDDELVSPRGPWVDAKPFKLADQPVERFLTAAEAERLVNACQDDFRTLVHGALFTGCRYAELGSLLVADVTITEKEGRVLIRESKSGKPRHIPLSPEGREFFEQAIAGKAGDSRVFNRKGGGAWGRNHGVRPLAAACDVAKIKPPISFHELRHTYASLLAQAGADLLTISKLLGHADTRITARHYAHLCDQTLANAVDSLLPSFGFKKNKDVTAIE